MVSFPSVDVRATARVRYIDSASELLHYPYASQQLRQGSAVPWVSIDVCDESACDTDMSTASVDDCQAIVLASGAMMLSNVRDAVTRNLGHLTRYMELGGSLVLEITAVPQDTPWQLIIPEHGVDLSFEGTAPLDVEQSIKTLVSPLASPEPAWSSALDDRITAARIQRGALDAGRALTIPRDPDAGLEHWLKYEVGRGTLQILTVPLLARKGMDIALIMLAEAAKSSLAVSLSHHPTTTSARQRVPGGWIAINPDVVSPDSTDQVLSLASHVVIDYDVAWQRIDALSRDKVLARLENRGSIEFSVGNEGSRIRCLLTEPPEYLSVLDEVTSALGDGLSTLSVRPTFDIVAFAALCREAQRVLRDPDRIPPHLRLEQARSIVGASIDRRVKRGSVDGKLLPTANLLAAAHLADVPLRADMLRWVKQNGANSRRDFVEQARWWAIFSGCEALITALPAPSSHGDSAVGQMALMLAHGRVDGSLLNLELSAVESDMFSLTKRTLGARTENAVVSGARHASPNIESLCIGALARLHEIAESSIGTSRPRPVAESFETDVTKKLREEVVSVVQRNSALARQRDEMRDFGRAATNAFAMVATPLLLAILLTPVGLLLLDVIDLANAITLTTIALAVESWLITYIARRLSPYLPPWLFRATRAIRWSSRDQVPAESRLPPAPVSMMPVNSP